MSEAPAEARGTCAALFLVLLMGCATTTPGPRPADSTVLTRAEIDETGVQTAFDAIRQLRPRYLRGRAIVSVAYPWTSYPLVYVNGLFRGDLSSLRSILVHDIEEIRYINPGDATTRWGTGHSGGVIHVLAN
jgi:hypothetical protein